MVPCSVSESNWFSDREPKKGCCNTVARIYCGNPLNHFLKRSTFSYLADYTLRKGKNRNISKSVGLHVQVDISTLKNEVSWLPCKSGSISGPSNSSVLDQCLAYSGSIRSADLSSGHFPGL